ncbi:hypothetical protein BOX15_Mlig034212g1 [Macrostomum lignano]|uniref:LRRCT domain-containing protein n=1 Tax=Macrostomum lignano TaxID=282301 RepID=A0A267H786_9PLAT|nr:hypothetical protein BOX15_Mlig034212g1 [Macrostomum lignano]
MASSKSRRPLMKLSIVGLLICVPLIFLMVRQPQPADRAAATGAEKDCPEKCNCTVVMRKHSVKKNQVTCHGLSSIPDGIPVNTQVLILNGNSISKINGELKNLSKLEELSMVENKLEKIGPGNLTGLSSLSRLYLTRNKLSDWPDLCDDVGSSLTHLGIDENFLTGSAAPDSYAKCSKLQSLVLTKNTFPQLSNDTLAALGAAGSLKSVKLNSVKMTALDPTALLPLADHLTSLDLSQNPDLPVEQVAAAFSAARFSNQFLGLTLKSTGWTELPDGFLPSGNFPNLDILHLDGSQKLSSIQPNALAGGSSLTRLFLNQCPLTSLDAQLSNLRKLTDINLSGTRLSKWTSDTFGQPTLRQLDLSNAHVTTIGGLDGVSENPLPGLASLADGGLRLAGNPLVCNCSLLWLSKQLGSDAIRKKFYKLDQVTCRDQASGKSIKLTDCKPADCNSTTTTTTATTTSTATTQSPTEKPAIPGKAKLAAWVLPVAISAGVLLLAALMAGSVLLARRCSIRRQQQQFGDGEQRRSLVSGDEDDDDSSVSNCFKLRSRRSRSEDPLA